jgi:uncharacterized protein YyaL (SSP411 family)
MIAGGIYDQAGGGFSRYSTDAEWLAPHFEKMLYDNALLLSVLADAFAITKDRNYEKTIRHTIDFLQRELMNDAGGFYAALDADSEGVEGKFYVWEKEEIEKILKEDAELFCAFFDVSEHGNWEEKNILRRLSSTAGIADKNKMRAEDLEKKMEACLQQLLTQRKERIRPGTDDKILLGWNALLITALCKTAAVLNDPDHKKLAIQNFDFLIKNFRSDDHGFYHTYKNGVAKYPAFLDDHAYMIQCCIQLQQITSDQQYLLYAKEMTKYVLENFSDEEDPFLFYTGKNQTDVIVRKKEIYDGATPSGNSVMAENLVYLGIVFDESKWTEKGQQMMQAVASAAERYAGSFAVWASGILKQTIQWNEVALTGTLFEKQRDALLQNFIPNTILQCSVSERDDFPLLAGKGVGKEVQFFLCKNYSCMPPFDSVESLLKIIRQNDNI